MIKKDVRNITAVYTITLKKQKFQICGGSNGWHYQKRYAAINPALALPFSL